MKKVFAPLALIWGLSLFAPINAFAQESDVVGLIASPPYLSAQLEAGAHIEETITIINHRAGAEQIRMISREVGIDANGDFYLPAGYSEDGPSRFESQGWLSYSPNEFYLEKGEIQEVNVVLDLPEELPTDGYYLELVATTVPNNVDSGVGVAPEIAIPLVVNAVGDVAPERTLSVISFQHQLADFTAIYEYLPIHFLTTVQNRGNQHIIPGGQIFISQDPDFRTIEDVIDFNSGQKWVMADSAREFDNVWDKSLITSTDGQFDVSWESPLRIGHYYAQLNLVWDQGQMADYVTLTTDFWVLPWKLIVASFVSVGAVSLGGWYLWRRRLNISKKK